MTRLYITVALAAAGLISAFSGRTKPVPTPAPPAGEIVLAGKFAGPTAAADAAITAGMFCEFADELAPFFHRERAAKEWPEFVRSSLHTRRGKPERSS